MTSGAAPIEAAVPVPFVGLSYGGYGARIGPCGDLRRAALALRARAFRDGASDADRFDDDCLHGLVTSPEGLARVAFRLRLLRHPTDLPSSYTGQFYELSPLSALPGPFLELGRVCQSEGPSDLMALRLAWAAIGALVDAQAVQMLIGCSSFPGADSAHHRAALATLRANHLGPAELRPGRVSPNTLDLPQEETPCAPLPHLLRSYLNMGGWVGDHAVRDVQLDTLHVFTGLCVAAIPEPRKARLRALAQAAQPSPLDLARAAP
ncbi:GNAT family N-acyltransferase [Marivita geojedonensis]|uniref:GNAT family N-acyltransferase n=1 Tax=Marivita geojedonensis TaxID=1123756 RepID=UPI000A1ED064|nr:GNAT family N-acyltransferase [Marivita geojedonensis]PRY75605.1 ornithine-acyl[acyl carrier protein] N-acyltransferase [Marivita geojedonensis]